jgi:glycosyltransferase involved in cell wall biosynthesis
MSKLKILLVVYDFFPAGAERFAYEIDRALDREKYEVAILCLKNEINDDELWNEPYYHKRHIEIGSTVLFFDNFRPSNFVGLRIYRWIKKKVFGHKLKDYNYKLIDFMDHFDVIHWIGEYSYLHQFPSRIVEKSIICVMSAKFQNPDIYSKFDLDLRYNLMSAFEANEYKLEFSEFKNYQHWFVPLLLKIPYNINKWSFENSKVKKIGIFTRLNIYKPLDPFFYAFHLLLDDLPNCELHIFGNGNPEKEGMTRYLKNLNIENKVFFRGHQNSIVETLISEHIDLSWFQGYNNNRPAGYAGFDVCSTGTPLICWDFIEKPRNPHNEVYPHYKNLSQFVRKSIEVLTNEISANSLSKAQFNDILANRDVKKNIYLLENAYQSIIEHNL